jgi:hypothetical protein
MKHFYHTIQGWFDFPDLYSEMVLKHNDAKFVEVGVWKGKSLSYLAVEIINSKKNITIDAIDLWPVILPGDETAPQEFLKNIEPIKDVIKVIKKDSIEASKDYENESIDFIFFDSDHSQNYATNEIIAWYPKVKKGGFIGGHDYVNLYPDKKGVGFAVTNIFKHNIKLYPGKQCPEITKEIINNPLHNNMIFGPSWLHYKKNEF